MNLVGVLLRRLVAVLLFLVAVIVFGAAGYWLSTDNLLHGFESFTVAIVLLVGAGYLLSWDDDAHTEGIE